MDVDIHQPKKHTSSYMITWSLVGLTQAGLALSMLLSKDTKWFEMHLSKLGEGGSFASGIFNFTMGFASIILVVIAIRLTEELENKNWYNGIITLRNILIAVSICWVGVASFPFDANPIVHNIFGYGQFTLIAIAMLLLKRLCPLFSERTYTLGIISVVGSSLLLAAFHMMQIGSILLAELFGQTTLFLWLLSLTRDVYKR